MNDFQHPIDVLAEDIRLRTNQAEEWETTSDPHAVNKPRAELLRHQIAQDEAAIQALRGQKLAPRFAGSEVSGQKSEA